MKRISPKPKRPEQVVFKPTQNRQAIIESYSEEKAKFIKIITDLFLSIIILFIVFICLVLGLYYSKFQMGTSYDLTRFGRLVPNEFQLYSHSLIPGETPELKWLKLNEELVPLRSIEPIEKDYLLMQHAMILGVNTDYAPVQELALKIEGYNEPNDIHYYELDTLLLNKFIRKYSPHSYGEMKQYQLINENTLKPVESIKVTAWDAAQHDVNEILKNFSYPVISRFNVYQLLMIVGSFVLTYALLGLLLIRIEIKKSFKKE